MINAIYEILENRPLALGTYLMKLGGDCSGIIRPGQFVNIAVGGQYLRRPIAVCERNADNFSIAYKVVGKGTEKLCAMKQGDTLDLLTGLGNGFDLSKCGEKNVLVGGSIGIAPLYWLAKALLAAGKQVTAVLGFASGAAVVFEAELRALGCTTIVVTEDGTQGVQGFVTDILSTLEYDYYFTCGPEAMMRAVYAKATTSGQLSLESRMGCGFGACMGCSCKTTGGSKRICREGPVFEKEELLW